MLARGMDMVRIVAVAVVVAFSGHGSSGGDNKRSIVELMYTTSSSNVRKLSDHLNSFATFA